MMHVLFGMSFTNPVINKLICFKSEKLVALLFTSHLYCNCSPEQEQRQKQLEEKVRVLQITKDDLHSHCNQQASLVSELQCKNSNLTLEVDTLKRRLEEMGQVYCLYFISNSLVSFRKFSYNHNIFLITFKLFFYQRLYCTYLSDITFFD